MHTLQSFGKRSHVRRPFIYLHSFAGGGAEQVFVRLANHFSALGLQPHFIVNDGSGPVRKALSSDVPVHELGVKSSFAGVPKLAKLIKHERPDVLLSALTRANLAAVVAKMLSGNATPLIVSERNHLSALLKHRPPARRVATRQMVRTAYPWADAVLAVAEGVAEDLSVVCRIAREGIGVIHNPSPERAVIAAARNAPRPHAWLGEGQRTLIAIGRLTPQKDYLTLLAALAKVREAQGDVRLIILGTGPLLADLRQRVTELRLESAVDFAGFVDNPFDYLVRCSLYVLTSDTEGFPNALIEALTCGAPVVSTDCAGGGPKAILGETYPEALVPVGDADSLAKAIGFELDRPRPSDRIDAIANRFSIETIADKYISAFDAVVCGRRKIAASRPAPTQLSEH